MKLVELLAPAKDYAAAAAAVDYGADAVYIGGARFGARQAAGNSAEEIARVVEYAHRFGVRVHATLNTLVWDDELEAAERQARSLIDAGVDALIVQDMALRRMDLPVELHASTQVSNRTPEGARFLGEAGFARNATSRWRRSGPSAPPPRPRSNASSTGRSAWGTAAAVSSRGRCPRAAAIAGRAASPAA